MRVELLILCFIVSIGLTTSYICPTTNGTYAHEWNKAIYYRCSRGCAYVEYCPSNSYYSPSTNQCKLEPADWSPRFDLTGRYQWPSSTVFIEIRQIGYNVQWTTDETFAKITFVGRYVNATMIMGLEILVTKRSNCVLLQNFDLTVSGKRNFCRTRVALHWYSRTCGIPLSDNNCHVY